MKKARIPILTPEYVAFLFFIKIVMIQNTIRKINLK